jgi:hypothetical protein
MSLALIPLVVSIAFLLRIGLILVGLLKGPILQTFEKYGDAETIYYPLPSLLMWSGIFLLSITAVLTDTLGVVLPTSIIGIGLLVGAYLAFNSPDIARQYPRLFMSYPRWYFELRDRTSRYERRRLAYMWLWLPYRLRMIYNGSDRAFNQWADLVILATMRFEDNPDAWTETPFNVNYRV